MKRSRQLAKTDDGSTSVDLIALADFVEQFSNKTVVLLGDFVADEFQYGEISRVSREAPVLILRHRETLLVPGGGANAARVVPGRLTPSPLRYIRGREWGSVVS